MKSGDCVRGTFPEEDNILLAYSCKSKLFLITSNGCGFVVQQAVQLAACFLDNA